MTSAPAIRYRTLSKLLAILTTMEALGETEMGELTCEQASKFHAATDMVRRILDEMIRAVNQRTPNPAKGG